MQEAFQNLSMEHFNLMGTMENLMKGQQQENYLTAEEEAADKAKAAADEAARLKIEADNKAKTDAMAKASASSQSQSQSQSQSPSSPSPSSPSPPADGREGGKCRTAEPRCDMDYKCNNDKCEVSKPGPAENFEAFSNYSQYSDY